MMAYATPRAAFVAISPSTQSPRLTALRVYQHIDELDILCFQPAHPVDELRYGADSRFNTARLLATLGRSNHRNPPSDLYAQVRLLANDVQELSQSSTQSMLEKFNIH